MDNDSEGVPVKRVTATAESIKPYIEILHEKILRLQEENEELRKRNDYPTIEILMRK